jgi:hypothetical protein
MIVAGSGVMKTIHAAILVAAAATIFALAPAVTAADARGASFGGRSFNGAPHFFRHGQRFLRPHPFNNFARSFNNYSRSPLLGGYGYGYYAVPPYASDSQAITYLPPDRVVLVSEPPRALACKHSIERVTVPAEAGGTRDVTVTRC